PGRFDDLVAESFAVKKVDIARFYGDYDFPEYFSLADLRSCAVTKEEAKAFDECIDLFHSHGDKIFGYPTWIQGKEEFVCPICSTIMMPAFQFEGDGSGHVDLSMGDSGNLIFFVCETHPCVELMFSMC
ncbi:hypothetical protein ADUPG1_000926, partial [Aduncisulcus paluster]